MLGYALVKFINLYCPSCFWRATCEVLHNLTVSVTSTRAKTPSRSDKTCSHLISASHTLVLVPVVFLDAADSRQRICECLRRHLGQICRVGNEYAHTTVQGRGARLISMCVYAVQIYRRPLVPSLVLLTLVRCPPESSIWYWKSILNRTTLIMGAACWKLTAQSSHSHSIIVCAGLSGSKDWA